MSLKETWDRRLGRWQAARQRSGSVIESMVIDMTEALVRTPEQVRQPPSGAATERNGTERNGTDRVTQTTGI